jgi:hypothetical protein
VPAPTNPNANKPFQVSPFQRAVVVSVAITNGDQEIIQSAGNLGLKITNEFIVPNTIIARRITNGADDNGTSAGIFYPFFSSHMSMPVKPGETVWVIFDTPDVSAGYWMSRVHGSTISENINYTHSDRSFTSTAAPPTTAEKSRGDGSPPAIQTVRTDNDFPNQSLTQDPSSNPFDEIYLNSAGVFSLSPLEPIPRLNKRPGDFLIQGSNNSAIILGTDRGWPSDDSSLSEQKTTNAKSITQEKAGAIDIVVGRSRWINGDNSKSGNRTVPPTFQNSPRGYFEPIRDFIAKKATENFIEGDPDFLDDASRIYATMNSEVDLNFSLGKFSPRLFTTAEVPPDVSGAAIVAKSDEIRIIARKSVENGITGSIRIVKEGDPSDDLASILLLDDGIVQISGKSIYLGRHKDDGGAGDGPNDESAAVGMSQPYVKYEQLRALLTDAFTDVQNFCNSLLTHKTPGYGAPSVEIVDAARQLNSNMNDRISEIPNVMSKRIFGE